ncbi:MAG: UDP-glucose 4-epimerase GalE [Caulobacteraceae bacterium]|nr:UDP-glucose 4-epimerase GalE [Caulobacter sp.]
MSPSALVTGGAGYIGAHLVRRLQADGWAVTVLDDLSTGRREVVPPSARFELGDVGDGERLATLLADIRPEAVFHLAAYTSAPGSIAEPLRCYRANVEASRVLIEAALAAPSRPSVVFSSTAAIYGAAGAAPLRETAPAAPLNPYGASKLMTERMLADAHAAHGLPYVALRYFNVAGCGAALRGVGRAAAPGTLLDVALEAAQGERRAIPVYGLDHPTPDGSGVRDYIHVEDLADAHLEALPLARRAAAPRVLNCGYGAGVSVLELIDEVGRACGRRLAREVEPRRPGDPSISICDPALMLAHTNWRPVRDSLPVIVADAWSAASALGGSVESLG